MNFDGWNRRSFVNGVGALAWLGAIPALHAAEPAPETKRIRLSRVPTACLAPQYIAEVLLRAEGFSEIDYIGEGTSHSGIPGAQAMGAGEIDIAMNFAAPLVIALDDGVPIKLLGGVHVGCFELFGADGIRTIKDLRGKTIATLGRGSAQHVFVASIATFVGIDPNREIRWADMRSAEGKALLAEGRIDAFLAFPPDAQDLRARKIGHVLLNSAIDRPWSQYFCCLLAANADFAARYPIATKRAMRAILKASEICASDPDRAVKAYLALGFQADPVIARQAITELPYGHWRDYNPEETVRFYALRLREAGMVRAAPQKLIAQGTDWRLLEQLKKELKA